MDEPIIAWGVVLDEAGSIDMCEDEAEARATAKCYGIGVMKITTEMVRND